MAKKEELRKIPTKNYVIVVIMFLVTFLLVYYLYSWYKAYNEYQKEIPVIRNTLLEINSDEVDHYIKENADVVIYLCTASSNECRKYENNFKKLIEKKSLEESITYVNLSDVNTKEFTDKFNDSYKYKKELKNNYPAIVIFKDGNVVDMVQGDSKEKLTVSEVSKILKENKIGE